jgi:hypothetical protein
MRTSGWYPLTAAVLFVTLVLPCRSAATTGQTSHFRLTGLTADASFDSLQGCVETSAFITATSNRVKTVGRPETTPSAFVSLFQFDNCSFTTLLAAFGFTDLPAGAFQVKGNLISGTLNTSLDVFDFVSSTTFPVDISLSWTGIGRVTVSKDHSIFRAPGFQENFTFTGDSRAATASGSVTALGTNFSPNPTGFADLNSVKEGDLVVSHPSH